MDDTHVITGTPSHEISCGLGRSRSVHFHEGKLGIQPFARLNSVEKIRRFIADDTKEPETLPPLALQNMETESLQHCFARSKSVDTCTFKRHQSLEELKLPDVAPKGNRTMSNFLLGKNLLANKKIE